MVQGLRVRWCMPCHSSFIILCGGRGQKRTADAVELELQVVVSHPSSLLWDKHKKHLWVGFFWGGVVFQELNLKISVLHCFKVSLVQAGLVCVLRKGSTPAGGELGIVAVTFCIRWGAGFLLLVSVHQDTRQESGVLSTWNYNFGCLLLSYFGFVSWFTLKQIFCLFQIHVTSILH